MTKAKFILGGVAGAVGLTGASLIPSLSTSTKKVDSGGKAVSGSWSKDTKAETSFYSFGNALAPFLVDVDSTDDVFWEKRSAKNKEVDFDQSSLVFDGWTKVSNKQERISQIKARCKSFQNSSVSYLDPSDIEKTMILCGAYDDEKNEKIKFSESHKPDSSGPWTAQQVCNLLSSVASKVCGDLGISISTKK